MEAPTIMRIMASSLVAASKAGSIIRKVLIGGDLGIIEKGVNDLQTQADRSAQQCIISSLSHNFPGLCIIGEEDLKGKNQPYSEVVDGLDSFIMNSTCPSALECVSLDDIVVWVDPLDGTSEFAEGFYGKVLKPVHGLLEHVTVLIGVSVKGRPVGGVVCQPFYLPDSKGGLDLEKGRRPKPEETTQRLVWGLEGLGLFGLNKKPFAHGPMFHHNTDTSSNTNDNVIITTRSHPSKTVTQAISACSATKVYNVGGCGFKMLMLIEGYAHCYIYASTGCKRWDTCAPEALLNCMGGKVTGMDGKAYCYSKDVDPVNKIGVLATPVSAWHSAYLERIPSSLIQSLSSA